MYPPHPYHARHQRYQMARVLIPANPSAYLVRVPHDCKAPGHRFGSPTVTHQIPQCAAVHPRGEGRREEGREANLCEEGLKAHTVR